MRECDVLNGVPLEKIVDSCIRKLYQGKHTEQVSRKNTHPKDVRHSYARQMQAFRRQSQRRVRKYTIAVVENKIKILRPTDSQQNVTLNQNLAAYRSSKTSQGSRAASCNSSLMIAPYGKTVRPVKQRLCSTQSKKFRNLTCISKKDSRKAIEMLPKKITSQLNFPLLPSISMNPISDVVGLDSCRLPKRCASTIDFASAPPHCTAELPLIEKLLFLDTTVVEEMHFPRLSVADLDPERFPELPMVPLFNQDVKRSLSLPTIASCFDSEDVKLSANKCR